MPRYSNFRYGTRKYGEDTTDKTNLSSQRPYMFAQVLDYGLVVLTVAVPSFTLGDVTPYVIVRSRTGAAADPSNGLIIKATNLSSASPFQIVDGLVNEEEELGVDIDTNNPLADSDVLLTHGFYYYTLFTFDSAGTWTRGAATSVLIPKNKGTADFFVSALPGFYTSPEHNPIDPYSNNSDLYNFLYGFAVTYDELSSHIDLVLPDNRGTEVIRRFHDNYVTGVGMPNEYTIGVGANARIHRESGYIYRNKGTALGIADYVESLTGWQTTVTEGDNLILSLDDGSFEYSTGNWSCSGGTITQTLVGGAVTSPAQTYETGTTQFARRGVGVMTMSAASSVMTLPSDSSTLKSMPVVAGVTYYADVRVRARTGTPTVAPAVTWLDQFGTVISTSTSTATASTTAWTTISNTFTAPAKAAFAVLKLNFASGASGNIVHLDMLCFCAGSQPYRDPRSVDIICYPNRVNLVKDPTFESSSTPWTAVTGTFTLSTDHFMFGTKAGKAVGASFEFKSEDVPALPSYSYSLSSYAYSSGGSCTANIKWYTSGDVLIRTDSQAFGTLTTSWTREDMTVLSPSNASYAQVTFSGSGTVYVDTVTFERTDRPQIFFSGDISDFTGQDSLWSSTQNKSYSVLYDLRGVKLARLANNLPYYLPIGVTSRVLLWDSPEPAVQAILPYGA